MSEAIKVDTNKNSKLKFNSSLKSQEIQKKLIFKPLLTNPYTKTNAWTHISPDIQTDILKSLETNILPSIKQWNLMFLEKKKNKDFFCSDNNDLGPNSGAFTGFNNIMKLLESQISNNLGNKKDMDNNIKVLLVCKNDISSRLIYSHFPTVCALANVKLIQLPKGSSSRLTLALDSKKEITILALSEKKLNEDDFLSKMIDSVIDDINIGFVNNIKDNTLDMNVKYLLTEMPMKDKQNNNKNNKKSKTSTH